MSKSLKIFDKNSFGKLLERVKIIQVSKIQGILDAADTIENATPAEDLSISDALTCSFCKTNFEDSIEQRLHYKGDWHRYNLKQSLRKLEHISEEDFIKLADDVSSISGSDTEIEDNLDSQGTESDCKSNSYAVQQGKIFFSNVEGKVFSLYRNILHEKKNTPKSDEEVLKYLRQYINSKTWIILMLGGGHFAGAVFEGSEMLAHKTFHRYTVRAKQGGSQSAKDGKGGSAKSAGANLRRYNEKVLTEEIETLLQSWSEYIDKSHVIFYRAVGAFNRSVLFGSKISILKKSDSRLRTIPLITRRPTLTEVNRVYDVLTSIDLYDSLELIKSQFETQKAAAESSPTRTSRQTSPKNKNINRAKSRESKERPLPGKEEQSTEDSSSDSDNNILETEELEINLNDLKDFHDTVPPEIKKRIAEKRKRLKKKARIKRAIDNLKSNLYHASKEGNLDLLKQLLEKVKLNAKDANIDEEVTKTLNMALDVHGNTVLHIAAIFNRSELIIWLLENESSPCNKNDKQNTPYTINADKEIRNVFRKYATDNPDKYNYAKAQIPVISCTLTEEELAEKKRAQKKVKREREKEKRKENEVKRKENEEKERFLALSDREKRALAAERRLIAQTAIVLIRCFFCGQDMSGKVPFEYSGNRFCSIECLKQHRTKSPVVLS